MFKNLLTLLLLQLFDYYLYSNIISGDNGCSLKSSDINPYEESVVCNTRTYWAASR